MYVALVRTVADGMGEEWRRRRPSSGLPPPGVDRVLGQLTAAVRAAPWA